MSKGWTEVLSLNSPRIRDRRWGLVIVGLLFVACFESACSQPSSYQRALRYLHRGDHGRAISLLKPLALGGDVESQRLLGYSYFNTRLKENYAIGLDWLRRSAFGGNRRACSALAEIYHRGKFVPTDDVEALAWASVAGSEDRNQELRSVIKTELTSEQREEADTRRQQILMEINESVPK
jgi:hypothetical protein